jgi:hypothetical protein
MSDDEQPDAVSTPAGWYPDTKHPGQVRYWDGGGCTEHVAVGQASDVTGPAEVEEAEDPDLGPAEDAFEPDLEPAEGEEPDEDGPADDEAKAAKSEAKSLAKAFHKGAKSHVVKKGHTSKVLFVGPNGIELDKPGFGFGTQLPWEQIRTVDVDGADALQKRITATRLLTTGVFAFAMKKRPEKSSSRSSPTRVMCTFTPWRRRPHLRSGPGSLPTALGGGSGPRRPPTALRFTPLPRLTP